MPLPRKAEKYEKWPERRSLLQLLAARADDYLRQMPVECRPKLFDEAFT
jgi:hypothetical protein